MFLVATPDVASVRNAQRLIERLRQLGVAGERVRLLLNRAAEPYPIPPKQIEAAVGHPIYHTFPSDYILVSTALNSGVPLALTGDSELARQFDRFTRSIFEPNASTPVAASSAPHNRLGLGRIASFW
jgi:Flp pilus assembly CpaE family ATPase